jgi:hypothetical protein
MRITIVLKACLTTALLLTASGWGQTPSAAYSRVITNPDGSKQMITSRLKSLLITNFTYGYNHKVGIPNLIATMQRIGAKEGWKVDVAAAGTDLTAAKLKGYQVLFANYISYWAQKTGFPAAGKTAVEDFVNKDGGGLVIMHATGDSKITTNWDWFYNVAHPTLYVGEGTKSGTAPVFIPTTARNHPVMDGIKFAGHDTLTFNGGEWHQFSKNIYDVQPKAEVLLKMDWTKNTDAEAGFAGYKIPGGYPCSWAFPAGKGYIGYFMEGHDQGTMDDFNRGGDPKNPMWDKYWTQFMYYLAGYESATVTADPRAQLDFRLDDDGITFHPENAPGVLISAKGAHRATLIDMTGRTLKEYRGSAGPIDYDFTSALQGARGGVYVMRIAVGNHVKSKRFVLH